MNNNQSKNYYHCSLNQNNDKIQNLISKRDNLFCECLEMKSYSCCGSIGVNNDTLKFNILDFYEGRIRRGKSHKRKMIRISLLMTDFDNPMNETTILKPFQYQIMSECPRNQDKLIVYNFSISRKHNVFPLWYLKKTNTISSYVNEIFIRIRDGNDVSELIQEKYCLIVELLDVDDQKMYQLPKISIPVIKEISRYPNLDIDRLKNKELCISSVCDLKVCNVISLYHYWNEHFSSEKPVKPFVCKTCSKRIFWEDLFIIQKERKMRLISFEGKNEFSFLL